jgi:hypothetical protein
VCVRARAFVTVVASSVQDDIISIPSEVRVALPSVTHLHANYLLPSAVKAYITSARTFCVACGLVRFAAAEHARAPVLSAHTHCDRWLCVVCGRVRVTAHTICVHEGVVVCRRTVEAHSLLGLCGVWSCACDGAHHMCARRRVRVTAHTQPAHTKGAWV